MRISAGPLFRWWNMLSILWMGAFGDSQEMVIFITELNTSYDAVRFLEENPCERYYQYNRKLLFEDREADIKRKLERLL